MTLGYLLVRASSYAFAMPFCLRLTKFLAIVFDVLTSEGEPVGTASVLITRDLDAIRETGHLGTEVLPEFRRQGYAARIARIVFPMLKDHGIGSYLDNNCNFLKHNASM